MLRKLMTAMIPVVALSAGMIGAADAQAGNSQFKNRSAQFKPNTQFRTVQKFQARPMTGNIAFATNASFQNPANKPFVNKNVLVTNRAFVNNQAFIAKKPYIVNKTFIHQMSFGNKNHFVANKPFVNKSYYFNTGFVGPYKSNLYHFHSGCYPYFGVSYPYWGCYPQYGCYSWYGWCGTGGWCY